MRAVSTYWLALTTFSIWCQKAAMKTRSQPWIGCDAMTNTKTTKANPAAAVVIERTYNAPIAAVWQALTDVDQMRQWYFALKEFRPEVGFEFEFVVEHE